MYYNTATRTYLLSNPEINLLQDILKAVIIISKENETSII